MKDFKVVGLTGGVGSGKTYIAQYAKDTFEVPVIFADEVGHKALLEGTETYQSVLDTFGRDILREDKAIDRKILGGLVFSNKEQLKKLNDLVHPYIHSCIKEEIERIKRMPDKNCVIVEAAILLESSLVHLCDEIWFVFSDKEVRIQRLYETRGYSQEKIKSVMDAQLSEEEMRMKSNHTIINNGDLKEIHKQLEFLLV